jgi:hypothetical protein
MACLPFNKQLLSIERGGMSKKLSEKKKREQNHNTW